MDPFEQAVALAVTFAVGWAATLILWISSRRVDKNLIRSMRKRLVEYKNREDIVKEREQLLRRQSKEASAHIQHTIAEVDQDDDTIPEWRPAV